MKPASVALALAVPPLVAIAACSGAQAPSSTSSAPPAVVVVGAPVAPPPAPAPSAAPSPEAGTEAPPAIAQPSPAHLARPAACRGELLRIDDVRKACRCHPDAKREPSCGFDFQQDPKRLRDVLQSTAIVPAETERSKPFDVTLRTVNVAREWVMVVLDADAELGVAWEDHSGRAIEPVEDKTCSPALSLTAVDTAAVALPPGGAIEQTISVRPTKLREVGHRWKARNEAEKAVVKKLDAWTCATIDDGWLGAGAYTLELSMPFWPREVAEVSRTRSSIKLR